ncbi:MAG: pyruvate dehydrogenase (acetyl-transferring) E1 component subunit alpha [Actinobacteria bacterium]|nr:MAG: pyruvate dehydrogenase (acetyl-transferring) E1 component subunit alpha [Actinomycetota bacterium]REK37369.1 MAG: pyruvate dehydrogenase (acetyl-transferring) E1 component subunit alpha [Actinomycetota bacterium]
MWQTLCMGDFDVLQVIDAEGKLVDDDPGLDPELYQKMYRNMVLARELDRRMLALQRQGRIGTYAMLEGQEAVQIGSALALQPNDFVFPSYREHGVQITRGLPMEALLAYWKGLPNSRWDIEKHRTGIVTVPIATQLPHAVGYSYVSKLRGDDTVTAVYFGDGATSEVDFHSGMNFAGVWKTPTVFICANNLYAISVPYEKQTASRTIAQKAEAYGFKGIRVDGMDPVALYLATRIAAKRARNGKGPTLIEALTYRYGPHATADDPSLYRDDSEVEEWKRKDPIERLRKFLEERGEWDERIGEKVAMEIADLVNASITSIEAEPLPERDDAVRQGYSKIPPHVIEQLHAMQDAHGEDRTAFSADEIWNVGDDPDFADMETESLTLAGAINQTLHQAMERDDSIIVLGEDVGISGGVFRITEGLQDKFGDERVIDTPLNESGIVGSAIGMALNGARPVAEIQFDGFVYPAFDQIVSHLGRFRFRTRGSSTVPVVVRFPNGAGIGAHEHHCDSPEAYFVHAPGLVVVCPSSPRDAKGLLTAALEGEDPVVFLEPKVLYRAGREDVPTGHYKIPIGRARIRREGRDLTLVTYGGLVPKALRAADEAEASVEVIDLRTLFPWDREMVLESVRKTGRLLLVQEPQGSAGVAAEVASVVAEKAMYDLKGPIVRITGFDMPWVQFAIEEHALVDTERIAAGISQALAG